MARRNVLALAGTAVGVGAGLVAQHSIDQATPAERPRRRRPSATRRGVRPQRSSYRTEPRIFVEEVGPDVASRRDLRPRLVPSTDVWHYQMEGLGGPSPRSSPTYAGMVSHNQGPRPTRFPDDEERPRSCASKTAGPRRGRDRRPFGRRDDRARSWPRRPSTCSGHGSKGLVLVNTHLSARPSRRWSAVPPSRVERITRRPFDALGDRAPQHRQAAEADQAARTPCSWRVRRGVRRHASANQIDFTYDMLADTPVDVIFDLIKSYRDFDAADHLDDITVPALVIGGTHDRLTLPKASEHLAENLPKAELQMLRRVRSHVDARAASRSEQGSRSVLRRCPGEEANEEKGRGDQVRDQTSRAFGGRARRLLDTVKKDDLVLIQAPYLAEPLMLAIYQRCLRARRAPDAPSFDPGAAPCSIASPTSTNSSTSGRPRSGCTTNLDVRFSIMSESNTRQLSQVEPERQVIASKARKPLLDNFFRRAADGEVRWNVTLFPTEAHAMEAEMSLDEYEDFYYGACLVDTRTPSASGRRSPSGTRGLIEWMKGRNEVHIEGEGTDLTLEVGGRTFYRPTGSRTSPTARSSPGRSRDKTRGYISFSYPATTAASRSRASGSSSRAAGSSRRAPSRTRTS